MARSHFSAVLCADWAKEQTKRSVYIAHVQSGRIPRVDGDWTLDTVLEEAAIWSKDGRVLTTFDLPLGVPKSYLAAAAQIPSWIGTHTFLEFLPQACATPLFFDSTSSATDWTPLRPFFAVPDGLGGLRSYEEAAARYGVNLLRDIDKKTNAKFFDRSGR